LVELGNFKKLCQCSEFEKGFVCLLVWIVSLWSPHPQVDVSNNGIQTLPDDDEHLIVVTGGEDDGLRNLDDELAALSEELNGKEEGPRIHIIVDQKVFIAQACAWFESRVYSFVTIIRSWPTWSETEFRCTHQTMISKHINQYIGCRTECTRQDCRIVP
jgi:hypothetical protein